jgi:branched-chain amino acid transport system substrate-binding protein
MRRRSLWIAAAVLLSACGGGSAPTRRPQPPRPAEPPREEPRDAPVRVGAILPRTGSTTLRQYGELVRQGIDIALAEHQRQGGPPVELVVADDGGDAANAPRAVRELEAGGVIAVIGPLLEQGLASAATARASPDLALVSPTAPARPAAANTYALNTEDTRGAEALAQLAVRRYRSIGVLYPRTEDFRRLAQAFRTAVQAAGGSIAADVGYDANTTTFAQPMERLRAAGVDVVFAPATERIIRQLAPQFEYYGLGAVQLLGSDAWTSEEVLRMLPPRNLEGLIATTPLLRSSPAVAWDQFVGLYEAAQRQTLDTPYPALGYDALGLVLEAAVRAGARRPAEVARALAATDDFRGATGVLSLRGGNLTRRPFLVQIRSGRLTPLGDTGG